MIISSKGVSIFIGWWTLSGAITARMGHQGLFGMNGLNSFEERCRHC